MYFSFGDTEREKVKNEERMKAKEFDMEGMVGERGGEIYSDRQSQIQKQREKQRIKI